MVTIWPTKLVTGFNVNFNPGTVVYGKVSFGNNVMIGPSVLIAGGNHGFKDTEVPMYYQSYTSKGITIGSDVWIGGQATILDGVSIGDGVIIGANSVVTKNIPPYAIVLGNPARVHSFRKVISHE